jgi:excisionase family DNA binding protein
MSRQDLSLWLTERDAAAALGVSVRTIRRKAEAREIERRARAIPGRRPEAVFRPVDIERLAAEQPFIPAANGKQAPETALARGEHPSAPRALTQLATFAEALIAAVRANGEPQARPKAWLGLQEASEYLGLTEGFLRRLARAGKLPSVRDGRQGTKVRRIDLDNLAVESVNGHNGRKVRRAGA